MPLSDHVKALFQKRGLEIRVTQIDFEMLAEQVPKDLTSRIRAGVRLIGERPDIVICHRDTDNTSMEKRRQEMLAALDAARVDSVLVAVIPARMTESWLLLSEQAIRVVAGNPNGRTDLNLPKVKEIERLADPKARLRAALIAASDTTGRRRERLDRRFSNNRRQLLERLDIDGPVCDLPSWQALQREIDSAVEALTRVE